MHNFEDTQGRVWSVPAISLRHVVGMKEVAEVDVDELINEGHLWNQNADAMIQCGNALWFLCRGQHEVSEEEFFTSFDGDTFDAAQEVLAQRIANFIPPRRREILNQVLEEIRKASAQSESATSEQEKQESVTPEATA